MSHFPSVSLPFLALLALGHSLLAATNLRIMTFNTWLSGARVENGLQKIAKHIGQLQPDIVALQVNDRK